MSAAAANGKKASEAAHLLLSTEANEIVRHWTLVPADHRPDVSSEHHCPAHEDGRLSHLIDRPQKLPDWMRAKRVILSAILESRGQGLVGRRTELAMMPAHPVGECPGLPTLHACRDDRDMINAAASDGDVAPDRFEAGTAEELACARDVLDADKAIVVHRSALEGRSDNTEPWVLGEPSQQEREVVRVEGSIGVETPDGGVGQMPHHRIAGVEGMHLAGKVSVAPIGESHEIDPVMATRIVLHDRVSAVGRAITDDHPS